MEYLISMPYTQEQINMSKTNSAQSNLFQGKIKTLKAIVPPLSLQQQFEDKINAIEQMKAETKEALQEAETLFQARMDYWFN